MARDGPAAPARRVPGWLLLLVLVLLSAPADASAGRQLHKERNWGDESGDPSGLSGILGARAFPAPGKPNAANRVAVTPEAAESSANSVYTAAFRPVAPENRRTFATVEATPEANSDRRKVTIHPRARSAQDVVQLGNKAPNLGSGEEVVSSLVVGGYALAETFQGAEAVAATDAVALNKGARKTTTAASMRLSRPSVFRNTDPARKASFGNSAGEGVGSLAMSGLANGKIMLAQANTAVAMSQAQAGGTSADQWSSDMSVSDRKAGRRLLAWCRSLCQRAHQNIIAV